MEDVLKRLGVKSEASQPVRRASPVSS